MEYTAKSIRAFIGSKDFSESRAFYRDLGFLELEVGPKMSLFQVDEGLSFYLQDYYVKDWIDNSMLLLEVEDVAKFREQLLLLGVDTRYARVKISEVQENDWGNEIFVHDPSGVLWHFAEFR